MNKAIVSEPHTVVKERVNMTEMRAQDYPMSQETRLALEDIYDAMSPEWISDDPIPGEHEETMQTLRENMEIVRLDPVIFLPLNESWVGVDMELTDHNWRGEFDAQIEDLLIEGDLD